MAKEKSENKIVLVGLNKRVTKDNYELGQNPDESQDIFYEKNLGSFDNADELIKFLNKNYGLSEDKDNYSAFDEGRITYMQLEDGEGDVVEEKDAIYKKFKKGEVDLWAADYDIYIELAEVKTPSTKEISKLFGIKEYAKGGKLERYFGKAKDYSKRAVEGVKKGYGKAKDYTNQKIHDQKKKIALEVIDDTKDKVPNKEKMHLNAAEEIVSDEYAKGGSVENYGNWYKEGSDKWGLERSETYIKENNGVYDVFTKTFSEKEDKWIFLKHTFPTFEEAKKYGYEDSLYAQGGSMAKGGYVAIHESKDGYWVIATKPTTKQSAQEQIDLGVPRGTIGKVVTIEEAKAHKKVVGSEYLSMATGGGVGDEVDIISMDVPLFIRMLEYAKEDAKTDMDLHKVTENATNLSKSDNTLTMANYDSIVNTSGSMATGGEAYEKGGRVETISEFLNKKVSFWELFK